MRQRYQVTLRKFPDAWIYTRDAINIIDRSLILAENTRGEYDVKINN